MVGISSIASSPMPCRRPRPRYSIRVVVYVVEFAVRMHDEIPASNQCYRNNAAETVCIGLVHTHETQ